MDRRKFLKALGMSPIAAPVVAKEAAQSMGLCGPLAVGEVEECAGYDTFSEPILDAEWGQQALKEFMSQGRVDERMRHARNNARRLDPDLAANRSMSPAVAYGIQVDRCYKRLTNSERSWIERELMNCDQYDE